MKYELTDQTITVEGKVLHRIKALIDIRHNVKAGDIGGFVEKEDNLEQIGECWIFGNACVFDDARMRDNALISGNARVSGNALISGNARIFSGASISGNAHIDEDFS